MVTQQIDIREVADKKGRAAFVDLGRRFAAQVPHAVPQLRSELLELVDPKRNPFFDHADVALFIAYRGNDAVGRISAQIDHLALDMPPEQGFGPGTGMFGYFDASDEEVGAALLAQAEEWLRGRGMTRVLGPISMSIWEEPGLLVQGHDHAPMIMMGHDPAHYQGWIERQGYAPVKSLYTYELTVDRDFPPIVQRIVRSGERNARISLRPVDMKNFERDLHIVLHILNDAWSGNWGFVPFTDAEIAHAAKKLKQIVHPDINLIAELEGEPVAFMMTLPDINDVLTRIDGKLLPFGWIQVLRWLRNPQGAGMRVPLMGVLKKHQGSRLASQLAFMLIGRIRRTAAENYGTTRGEVGWVLDDNQGMLAIAEAIDSRVNREYRIYEKAL